MPEITAWRRRAGQGTGNAIDVTVLAAPAFADGITWVDPAPLSLEEAVALVEPYTG